MNTFGFEHLSSISFPIELVQDIYKELQETGLEGFERLALCAGKRVRNGFFVTNIIYPRQQLSRSILGVSFFVGGDELERIGDWLFEKQLSLIAQVHSHPSSAYHSEADDSMAIITRTGGISIVVPDFGNSDQLFKGSAFYRLQLNSGWTEMSKEEASSLIKIVP